MTSPCLCGAETYDPLPPVKSQHDGVPFTPVRCRACDLVGLHPRLALPELLAYYQGLETRDDLEDKIRARFKARIPWVEGRAGAGRRLLDVGCGGGQFPAAMKDAGWSVEGVEADAGKAAAGEAEFGFPIHAVAFDQWQTDARFDVITAWHVLEHFIDPGAVLARAAGLLEPGEGRLLAEVPNFRSLGRVLGGPSWVHFDVPYHQHFFTPDSLSALCERAGLEVLEVSRVPLDSDWWSLKRTLQARVAGGPLAWLRPLLSFRPVPALLVWLGAALGYTETFRLVARRRPEAR